MMLEGIDEAIGAVIGLVVGGIVLLLIRAEIDTTLPVNVDAWILLFFLGALVVAAVTMYAVIMGIFGGSR